MFGTKHDTLKRGEYKSYTFRLPSHVPELTFSIVAERGCVCLYASNCAERPLPRMCQWTLLVDAQDQQSGTLSVRTAEHHFVSGNYHVGLYCVADAKFSLACFDASQQSSTLRAMVTAEQKRNVPAAAAAALLAAGFSPRALYGDETPRDAAPAQQHARATKKPFIDEGTLEQLLSARARQPKPNPLPTPLRTPMSGASTDAPSVLSARHVAPGDVHHDQLLGEWHRSLRGAIFERAVEKNDPSWLEPPKGSARRRAAAAASSPRGARHAAPLGSTLPAVVNSWGGEAGPRVGVGVEDVAIARAVAEAGSVGSGPVVPPSIDIAHRTVHRVGVGGGMTPRWIGGNLYS